MTGAAETKQQYYEWHGADEVTFGEIEHLIKPGSAVLDLGCGTGWLAKRAYSAGAAFVVGLDIDAGVIQASGFPAYRDGAKTGLFAIQGSADVLPFSAESFDLVIAKDVFEHLQQPALALVELHRVLRPGGRIYAASPTPTSRGFWDDYTHVRPFTRKGFTALFEDTGFVVETIYFTGNYPGVGRYLRLRKQRKLPGLSKWLAARGILRNNVHAVAIKPGHTSRGGA